MDRRKLLQTVTAAVAGAYLGRNPEPLLGEEAPQVVKIVYVVTKCHLDVGFTDTERNVLLTYFHDYFPRAISLSDTLHRAGGVEQYVWTIGAWMIYEYLEQASPGDRKKMEDAIVSGGIAWHGMPFTWQSEMLDRSLIDTALKISATLDKRFGKRTIACKLTDVPGHTRGLIAPLAEAGIEFLDIGDNPGCKAPDVPFLKARDANSDVGNAEDTEILAPDQAKIVAGLTKYGLSEKQARRLISDAPEEEHPYLFNWRNPEGAQIMVLYHPFGYGGTVAIPGTDMAVSIRVRTDNTGPHTAEEVKAYYVSLRRRFPDARIVAADLSTIATALRPLRPRLPMITQEIGDTWIYGPGSDPGKVARYRELSRLRREWIEEKRFNIGSNADIAFASRLILASEHNWGLSTGQYLKHPEVYSPKELSQARAVIPEFQKVDDEWAAKRRNMDIAVSALPQELQPQARKRLQALTATSPDVTGLKPSKSGRGLESAHFILSLDPATGAIIELKDRKSGREWASPTHPLATFLYQTFSSADFARFNAQYNTAKFASNDFGKPGLDKYPVESRTWRTLVQDIAMGESVQGQRLVAELKMPEPEATLVDLISWPERLTLEVVLPKKDPAVHITFQCFKKRANRLPEAMWLSFSPDAPDPEGWLLEKVNQPVSPLDVIVNGNRHLHAVTKDVLYRDNKGSFTLETLDAPLIAPGQRSLIDFNNKQPDMREGVHVNLYNNLWGTAFPQWYGEDMRFRFTIKI
jgi:hypothetical protein